MSECAGIGTLKSSSWISVRATASSDIPDHTVLGPSSFQGSNSSLLTNLQTAVIRLSHRILEGCIYCHQPEWASAVIGCGGVEKTRSFFDSVVEFSVALSRLFSQPVTGCEVARAIS